ncbi:hypothetical protein HHI36_000391 [Cryptolaemus montrouzieri]|uniref:BTB domain-containing protein n=1 Tax=Cryptolaemus montrouzieri TaxID=559131 RepID=A0ABD2P4H9_9CUCU
MLQELSKKFGCTNLYQLLSDYDMQGLFINRKGLKGDVRVVFQIKSFPEYYDVVLKCSDHREIKAHKCILAARMEYFNSMFSVRWHGAEKNSLEIPYPSNLVDALLEFVYTDSPSILLKKDCDFLLKLIVIADEYLINQLKNHCAYILTSKYVDLKNAVEVLQFAHYYKANNLKEGVMNYIVNNMAYFLEIQALNDLSDEILTDLSQNYFEKREQICCRVITPYSTAVADEVIISVNETFTVNTEIPEAKKTDKTPSKYSRRRTRMTKSNTLESDVKKGFNKEAENLDNVIQFPDVMDTPEINNSTSVQKRLSAISAAVETLESEDCVPKFTNLKESISLGTSWNDFPSLGSPPENSFYGLNSPPSHGKSSNRHEGRHRMVRLSQKERKRLSSESKDSPPVVSESPKNPWKIIPPETSPIVSPSDGATFCNILSNERKQRENLVKIKNKLLIHTQLEDKAIVELEKFYSVDSIEDEIITVERVEIGCIASPIWVPGNQAHSSHS